MAQGTGLQPACRTFTASGFALRRLSHGGAGGDPMDPEQGLDVTEPLLELSRGLDEAFDNPGDKPLQFAAALSVVATFLSKAISRKHANEFFELSSAFANLATGSFHPWLRPPKGIAPHDPSQLWRGRASAVVALEALHAAGEPLETAARELLRRHKGITRLGGGKLQKQAGTSTLLTWRKEFSSTPILSTDV
jgi:hypothetical protein